MQSHPFPWSLTDIAKLPAARIKTVSREFLNRRCSLEDPDQNGATPSRRAIMATCRLVIRLLSEAQLQCVVALARLVEQDFLAGNALVALLAETARHAPLILANPANGLADVDTAAMQPVRRPITARALARSFHRPYETTRRALQRLAELGLVDNTEDGVILHANALHDPALHRFLDEMHDIMVTLLDDMFVFAHLPHASLASDFPPAPAPSPLPSSYAGAIRLAALDMHLLSSEGTQGIFSDWNGVMLAAAIVTGNIREVTYHPHLAFAYAGANQVPPMHLRRPVLFKTLCETLPIQSTTAWRRIAVMKLLGSVRTIDSGLVLDSAWLEHPILVENNCARIERLYAIINRMVQTVPLTRIDRLYAAGRVPPIVL